MSDLGPKLRCGSRCGGLCDASFPSFSLVTPWSAKLRFAGVAETVRAPLPDGGMGKQSFQDKRVTKLELGHEGSKLTPLSAFAISFTLGTVLQKQPRNHSDKGYSEDPRPRLHSLFRHFICVSFSNWGGHGCLQIG